MLAEEFFSGIELYNNSGCSTVRMDVGTPITRLRYKNVVIESPSELLVLKDLYQPHEYIYTRFISINEMELVDSNDRTTEDLRVEAVSKIGTAIVIGARFVGTE